MPSIGMMRIFVGRKSCIRRPEEFLGLCPNSHWPKIGRGAMKISENYQILNWSIYSSVKVIGMPGAPE